MSAPIDKASLDRALGPIAPGQTYQTGDQDQPDPAEVEKDVVLQGLRILGRVLGGMRRTTMGWGFDVLCPWNGDHTDRVDSGAFYVPLLERFQCQHGHCADRQTGDARARVDELLREDSGGLAGLAALAFDEIDTRLMPPPRGQELAWYEATEDGLALAFADRHQDQLRFDHTRGRWFCWTGSFWRENGTQRAHDWARNLTRDYRRGLVDVSAAQVRAWGKLSVAAAIERAARADARLAVDGLGWDQDPWVIGAPDCEIDLRTGEVRPPDPGHLITKQVLVAPSDMATPIWDQFLWDSTGGDIEIINFLQAWSGYNLTGDTSEEKFVFFHGTGGNGKGTYLYTTSAILDDYGARTPADTFMVRKHDPHSEEVARLAGVRGVIAGEIAQGRTFNVGRLKDFTGRDGKLTGAFKFRDTFEFLPQFKITFVGNTQPRLTNVDEAIRRRMVLVPFTQKPVIADVSLKDRLVPEYPGILKWMIEGEKRRRASGGLAALIPSAAVAATREYLAEQDTLKAWGEENLVFDPREQIGVMKALEDYKSWCHRQGEHNEITRQDFSRKFVDTFPTCRARVTNQGTFLQGVVFSQQDV